MPTYDYTCTEGHTLEVTHSINTNPHLVCPNCAKEMKRKQTTPAIAFKGSGFYTTDKNK